MANQPYFEEVDPGDEFEDSWTADPEHVVAYVELNMGGVTAASGRFTTQEGAEAVGMPKPIVPGVMSMCLLTRVVTDWMGERGVLRFIDVDFRRPVQHGDNLRALGLVTDTDEEPSGAGVVKLDVYLENERGERPLQGVAIVELPRKGSG
jgi:acyl dehydratase